MFSLKNKNAGKTFDNEAREKIRIIKSSLYNKIDWTQNLAWWYVIVLHPKFINLKENTDSDVLGNHANCILVSLVVFGKAHVFFIGKGNVWKIIWSGIRTTFSYPAFCWKQY